MQDIVVLVPESGPQQTDNDSTDAIENRIAELATRWSRLVEWVHTHYAQLQNALLHWRHFDEEAEVLGDWLSRLAKEARSVSDAATASAEQEYKRKSGGGKNNDKTSATTSEIGSALVDEAIEKAGEIQAISEAAAEAVAVSSMLSISANIHLTTMTDNVREGSVCTGIGNVCPQHFHRKNR